MTHIEIHCLGRWVLRVDFEGLAERLGASHAEDVWDTVIENGSLKTRNGLIYIAAPSLLSR